MWDSVDVERWSSALSAYPIAISVREKDQKKTDLSQLEEFVFSELPTIVKSRDPPHITKEEYCKLVNWKLKRGKWRPRLQKFADECEEDAVRETSTEAFRLLGKSELRKALQKLVTLRGCGPATASVVLTVMDPTLPFMSDELLMATTGQANKYTVKVYLELKNAVDKKIAELSEGDSKKEWNAIDIEKAVFAIHHNTTPANGHPKEDSQQDIKKASSKDSKEDKKELEKSVDEEKKGNSQVDTKQKSSKPLKKTPSKRKAVEEAPKEAVEVGQKASVASIRRSKRTRRHAH